MVAAAVIFLISLIRVPRSSAGVFAALILISYCLYSDALLSVYLLFPALLLLFSYDLEVAVYMRSSAPSLAGSTERMRYE